MESNKKQIDDFERTKERGVPLCQMIASAPEHFAGKERELSYFQTLCADLEQRYAFLEVDNLNDITLEVLLAKMKGGEACLKYLDELVVLRDRIMWMWENREMDYRDQALEIDLSAYEEIGLVFDDGEEMLCFGSKLEENSSNVSECAIFNGKKEEVKFEGVKDPFDLDPGPFGEYLIYCNTEDGAGDLIFNKKGEQVLSEYNFRHNFSFRFNGLICHAVTIMEKGRITKQLILDENLNLVGKDEGYGAAIGIRGKKEVDHFYMRRDGKLYCFSKEGEKEVDTMGYESISPPYHFQGMDYYIAKRGDADFVCINERGEFIGEAEGYELIFPPVCCDNHFYFRCKKDANSFLYFDELGRPSQEYFRMKLPKQDGHNHPLTCIVQEARKEPRQIIGIDGKRVPGTEHYQEIRYHYSNGEIYFMARKRGGKNQLFSIDGTLIATADYIESISHLNSELHYVAKNNESSALYNESGAKVSEDYKSIFDIHEVSPSIVKITGRRGKKIVRDFIKLN
jgi:hypothetical protein